MCSLAYGLKRIKSIFERKYDIIIKLHKSGVVLLKATVPQTVKEQIEKIIEAYRRECWIRKREE